MEAAVSGGRRAVELRMVKQGGLVTIRNVLLLVSVAFFVIAFLVLPDGCAAYTSEDNIHFVCLDPSGVGQYIGRAAHMLFAGLAILSAALLDHAALVASFGSDD